MWCLGSSTIQNMAMNRIINSPVFYQIRQFFTGDNVAHYLPAKYLWSVCNDIKTGFSQPVYDFKMDGPISLDFLFYPEQPHHKYFQKPAWINNFILAKDTAEAHRISSNYNYFIQNYRNRGVKPLELNWGYVEGIPVLDLYVTTYTYKAVYEQRLSLDDLILANEYGDYLQSVKTAVNPEQRPVIVLHCRGNDRWRRHLPNTSELSEVLLHNLLDAYPDHQVVLLGEAWRYHRHPRIKYLEKHLNLHRLSKNFEDYSACLQFLLAAYYCRDADFVFGGISGFTQFIEMIRPREKMPFIPIFWGSKTFTGRCTIAEMATDWRCLELEAYRTAHPNDEAFHHDTTHFLYYSGNEFLLKPYCFDYPNSVDKVLAILSRLSGSKKHQGEMKSIAQDAGEVLVTNAWRLKPLFWLLRRIWQITFVEGTLLARLRFIVINRFKIV